MHRISTKKEFYDSGRITIDADGINVDVPDKAFVAESAAAAKWTRPALSSGDDLDTLTGAEKAGLYDVTQLVANSPMAVTGFLSVHYESASARTEQRWWSSTQVATGEVYRRVHAQGTWSAWAPVANYSTAWDAQSAGAGDDIDTFFGSKKTGIVTIRSGQVLNLPVAKTGWVQVSFNSSTARTEQIFWTDTNPREEFRRTYSAGTWSQWEKINATTPEPSTTTTHDYAGGMFQHHVREVDLRRARGPVRTGGKAAVALVFDHGTAKFKELIYPEILRRRIPVTLALNATTLDPDYKLAIHESGTTWDDVKTWFNSGLVEVANHSRTHRGVSGYDNLYAEVITGRDELSEKLGGIRIDSWVQPAPGGGEPDYDGFGVGANSALYYKTDMGKLIVAGHAVATGSVYQTDYVYPLDGHIPTGMSGQWFENGTGTQLNAIRTSIGKAIEVRGRTILRAHPYAIDLSPSYMSSSGFMDWLDELEAMRTAGQIEFYQLRDWAIADV